MRATIPCTTGDFNEINMAHSDRSEYVHWEKPVYLQNTQLSSISLNTGRSELGVPRADVGELSSRVARLVFEESPRNLTSSCTSCWGVFLIDQ